MVISKKGGIFIKNIETTGIKPDCALAGQDGNIFNLPGTAGIIMNKDMEETTHMERIENKSQKAKVIAVANQKGGRGKNNYSVQPQHRACQAGEESPCH